MNAEVRCLTIEEYHRMAEAGIFSPDEQVELLDGTLLKMAAKGTAHSSATTRMRRILEQLLKGRGLIRIQNPVQLDDLSERNRPREVIPVMLPLGRSLQFRWLQENSMLYCTAIL
jgi:Uma2 family endonuclease